MTRFRERKTWIVFIAVLMLFAACKGETPTAPPTGGNQPPGTNPPPSGVSVVVAVSSQNPLVDTTVTITATVTQDGQPVANGTAVEFETTTGALDGGGTEVIKTTTNGVATVTLTSTTATTARVTVTVNNIVRQTDVTFLARPITPTPPNTNPTITSVTPSIGRPSGGETIRINGTNFRGPLRVLFRLPNQALPTQVSIVSSTETTIDVVTPGVNLGVGQELQADIIVITQAGTATENRVERAAAFTFRAERLTPVVFSVTPNSGPVLGGTRVTLVGEGFQEPVQVLFDTAEARVLKTEFREIIVETPAASDTPSTGSGTVTGAVDVTVRNLNSQTSNTLTDGFNYKSQIQITAVGPTEGPFTGGTRVEIDGDGFVGPVAVSIGGVAATPIFVSGTKIIAITSGIALDACDDVSDVVSVTNIANGDTAEGPSFTYRVLRPAIINVTPNNVRGGTISITVANAIGTPRLRLGNTSLIITGTVQNPNGTTTFTATVPNTLQLQTQACPAVPSVSVQVPTSFDVVYTSLTTTCEDTLPNGAIISPPANTPIVTISPAAFTPFSAAITPATPDPDGAGPLTGTPASVAPSAPQTVTLTNTGTGTVTVTNVTAGPGCANFTVAAPTTPQTLEQCDPFPITAVYNGTTAGGTQQCTVTITGTGSNGAPFTRTLTLTGTSQ